MSNNKKHTILVVDDMPENIEILKNILAPLYTVKAAINGEVALKIVNAQPPDLILLDIMMPGIDGFEVCKRLSSNAKTKDIPVIFITAKNETADEQHGFEVGCVDFLSKPVHSLLVLARVKAHLVVQAQKQFLKNTFSRYLSDDVMASLLNSSNGFELGGKKQKVTILMSDLRGFTAIAEQYDAQKVMEFLNHYLKSMFSVINDYKGTVIEIMGDGLLVLFGAPIQQNNDAQRAVQCAILMQKKMLQVNEVLKKNDLPELEMGIGIHTCNVVVGNIGSDKHAKYGVVGSGVNLTGRIESYTKGNQILISPSTYEESKTIIKISDEMDVNPKGFEHAVKLRQVASLA